VDSRGAALIIGGMKSCLTCAFILLGTLSTFAADPAVDKQAPKPAEYLVGEMHIQTLPAVNYLYGGSETTFEKLKDVIDKYLPMLTKGIEAGEIHPKGQAMFIYKGVQEDMSKPFTLEVGWCVSDNTKAMGELKVRKLPEVKCATMLYTGSVANIAKVYEKLMPAVAKVGLTPAGDVREYYLNWEGAESLNNVIQVQVELK
jgi:effector-binding domain-containing protein